MPQRLLEIRLDVLKTDVARVKNVVDRVIERTQRIQRIAEDMNSYSRPLGLARHEASRALDVVEKSPTAQAEFAKKEEDGVALLGQVIENTDQVAETHAKVFQEIQQILKEFVPLNADLQRELGPNIYRRCTELGQTIKELRRGVTAATGDAVKYRSLWAKYDKMLEEEAQPLFAEYVDFVAGLALRDSALDDKVCALTDLLLEELTLHKVLVVPARQAALGQVMQSVVKLGFPEWTIWGIPLVGHEAGLNVAADEDVRGMLERDHGLPPRQCASLFADAFATYMLGPSYAYAVLHLRFEPHVPPRSEDDQPYADRARLILKVLRWLYEGDPGAGEENRPLRLSGSYRAMLEDLESFWAAEVEDLVPDQHAGAAEAAEQDAFFTGVRDTLAELPFRAFGHQRWYEAEDKNLQHYLLTGKDEPQVRPHIIGLLTAAWQARRIARPEQVDKIAERTMHLGLEPEGTRPNSWQGWTAPEPAGLKQLSDRR
jgi:hypothetical protein